MKLTIAGQEIEVNTYWDKEGWQSYANLPDGRQLASLAHDQREGAEYDLYRKLVAKLMPPKQPFDPSAPLPEALDPTDYLLGPEPDELKILDRLGFEPVFDNQAGNRDWERRTGDISITVSQREDQWWVTGQVQTGHGWLQKAVYGYYPHALDLPRLDKVIDTMDECCRGVYDSRPAQVVGALLDV